MIIGRKRNDSPPQTNRDIAGGIAIAEFSIASGNCIGMLAHDGTNIATHISPYNQHHRESNAFSKQYLPKILE